MRKCLLKSVILSNLFTVLLSLGCSTNSVNSESAKALAQSAEAAKAAPVPPEPIQSKHFSDTYSYPESLLSISETTAFSPFVFLVDKELRTVSIFRRDGNKIEKVNEFPADIGKKMGNKTKRNDARTPEGIYFLQKKLSPPAIPYRTYGSMAFTTNYPNLFDIREGKTGSGIWLHSVPDKVPLTRGSKGCVVVRNEVLRKIEGFIKLKETPILIFDHVNYMKKEGHENLRNEMAGYLDQWRAAWQSQDLDKYFDFYDPKFKAPGFNLKTWKKHKTNLKNFYKEIKITLSQPYILKHGNKLIIKTLQKYESDKHTDYGIKVIYAMLDESKNAKAPFKILREEWTAADEEGYQIKKAANDDRSDLKPN